MRLLKQSDTTKPIQWLMVDDTDHITGKTGLTPTVTISKNGGAFAAPTGTVSEVGNGWYKLTPSAADVGTLGPLAIHATGTDADPVDLEYQVVAFDPYSAENLGLSRIDATTSSRQEGYVNITAALDFAIDGSQTDISLSAGSDKDLMPGDVIRIGTEYMLVEAIVDEGGGVYSYTVRRCFRQDNVGGSPHSSGASVHHIGHINLTDAAGNTQVDKTGYSLASSERVQLDALQPDYAPAKASDILATPANKLATDASGQVAASNMRGTDGANTTTPPTASAIASAVWGAASRTLSAFGFSVEASNMRGTDGAYTGTPPTASAIASAVWGAATRTLSAFGFSVEASNMRGTDGANKVVPDNAGIAAIQSQTDKLQFGTGNDVKATLDGEAVTTDTASRNASKADVSGLATQTTAEAARVAAVAVQTEVNKIPRDGKTYRYTNATTGGTNEGETEDVTIGEVP